MPPRTAFLSAALLSAFAVPALAQEKTRPRYPDTAAAEHAGQDAVVTGKVVAVTKSQGGTTYLNFGDRFPRQTFSAVVLARDEAKVGDVKQFEGKTVAVTGRIEMLPGKAPQIVVREPGNVVLAEEAAAREPGAPVPPSNASNPAPTPAQKDAAAPAVAATKLPTPSPAPAPASKTPTPRKLTLGPGWDSPAQGGAMIRKDLATIFAGRGKASSDTDILLWGGIPYLTPLAEAKKQLKLEGASASKTKISTPGLPIGSLWGHTFSGVFEGGYNRLCLITDLADQLVSVQLIEDAPRLRTKDITNTFGFHAYDFIAGRSKGSADLIIKHEVTDGPPGVVIVESSLIDPTEPDDTPVPRNTRTKPGQKKIRRPTTGEVKEMSRWLVPAPLAQLILRCAEGR